MHKLDVTYKEEREGVILAMEEGERESKRHGLISYILFSKLYIIKESSYLAVTHTQA